MNKDFKKLKNIISNIITILIIIIAIIIYRKYDFNFYSKGIQETGKTVFSRDSNIKYSKTRSYKIDSELPNDAMFFKEIEVTPNTPYKVTCMVKTENVNGNDGNPLAGAQICLNGTEEHSRVLSGDNDWTQLEFLFNSKNNETVEIGFRLGGNFMQASGTAWFSDLSIEKGVQDTGNIWTMGCFILSNTNVVVDGERINISMNSNEKASITSNMSKFRNSIKEMSNNQINIEYEIIEISEPITTLSYDDENGYYVGAKDVYNLIDEYAKKREYDHIFVCTNIPLEKELTHNEDIYEWVGLGNMMYLGKGFSNIKIIEEDYSSKTTFPEEVFLHEFLHTLERNSKEYGYEIPELHSYESYNYKEERYEGLRKWYIDYMNGTIQSNGTYIGLPSEIYNLKPARESNFEYSYRLDLLDEPSNILESLESIISKIEKIFNKEEKTYNFEGVSQ